MAGIRITTLISCYIKMYTVIFLDWIRMCCLILYTYLYTVLIIEARNPFIPNWY